MGAGFSSLISQNSLYQGSLYQGLSVVFEISTFQRRCEKYVATYYNTLLNGMYYYLTHTTKILFLFFHISVQELSFEIRPISSPCWSTKRLFGSYGFNICPCSQTLFGKSQPMERKNRRCVDGTLFSYCQSHETWSYSLFF